MRVDDRKVQVADDDVAGRIEGDDRPAAMDEAAQVSRSLLAETAGKLGRIDLRIVAFKDLARRLLRQDDHIEAGAQVPLTHVGVTNVSKSTS